MTLLEYTANQDTTLIFADGSTKVVPAGSTLIFDRRTGQCEVRSGPSPWVGSLDTTNLENLIQAGHFAPKPASPDQDPARELFRKLLAEILHAPGYQHGTTSVGTRQTIAGPFTVTLSTSSTIKGRIALQWGPDDKVIWAKDIRDPDTPTIFQDTIRTHLRTVHALITEASEALPREAGASRPLPDLSTYTERDPAFASKIDTVINQLLRRPDLAACVLQRLQDTHLAGPWIDQDNLSKRLLINGNIAASVQQDKPNVWLINVLGNDHHIARKEREHAKAAADIILKDTNVFLLPEPPGPQASPWHQEVRKHDFARHDHSQFTIAQVTERPPIGKLSNFAYTVYPQGHNQPAITGSTKHKDPNTALNNAKTLADNLLITAGWRLE